MSDPCKTCGYDWLDGDSMSRQIDELKDEITHLRKSLMRWEEVSKQMSSDIRATLEDK
jgi:hypothetical protein